MHVVRVNILSGDHPKQVGGRRKGALTRGRSRPRSVEGGDGAERTPHEAVIRAVRVDVLSCNLAPTGRCPQVRCLGRSLCPRPNVECGDVAERTAHEAVIHAARINVVSRGRPQVADA